MRGECGAANPPHTSRHFLATTSTAATESIPRGLRFGVNRDPSSTLDSYSERPAAGSGLPSAKQFLGGSSELEH